MQLLTGVGEGAFLGEGQFGVGLNFVKVLLRGFQGRVELLFLAARAPMFLTALIWDWTPGTKTVFTASAC
jgi:hypothetical protein